MAADGFDLLLAGHTHGGQVCVPGFGALVTNCGLPRSMAKGLHRWPGSDAWLHVSAGLGTHPTAPVRFACRPEATPADPRPSAELRALVTRRAREAAAVGYYCSARLGVWRSLVARFVRDEEVVGSNPATPTRSEGHFDRWSGLLLSG